MKLKEEILPAIIQWQKKRGYPFSFNTQVSINLSDDEELIKLLTEANFTTVFIGIETPDPEHPLGDGICRHPGRAGPAPAGRGAPPDRQDRIAQRFRVDCHSVPYRRARQGDRRPVQ